MRRLLYPLIVASFLLATACTTTPGNGGGHKVDTAARSNTDSTDIKSWGRDKEAHYPVRPFPTQTLYSLLAAEIAGTRGQFDYSLQNYLREARQTRDIGVIARATRIAHYLDNFPALTEMSTLWTEVEPENIEARELAVFAHLGQNQIDKAFIHARFLLDRGHGEAIRKLPTSAARLPEQTRQGLLSAYRELVINYPDNPDALFAYTLLLWQTSELPGALIQAEKLAKLEPNNDTVALLEAQLLNLNDREAEALNKLEAALKKHPGSDKIAPQYLRVLFANPDLSASKKRLSKISERNRDNEDLQFGLALIHRETGDIEAANRLLQVLARDSTRVDEALYHLGFIAEKSAQPAQAETYYRQVAGDTHLLAATSRLTRLMAKRDDLEGARQHLQALRFAQTDMAIALYQLEAELLMQEHRYQPAHTVLSEGLGRYPNDMNLLYTRSLASEKLFNIAAVEADLRLILEQDANNSAALNALGYSLTNHTTRYEEAQSLIEKALSFSPNDPATIDSLGWVLYRRGLHTEALAHLRQAASLLPDAEIAAHLGEVLWVNGERDEARAILAEALEDSPSHPVLLETIERLQVDFH